MRVRIVVYINTETSVQSYGGSKKSCSNSRPIGESIAVLLTCA